MAINIMVSNYNTNPDRPIRIHMAYDPGDGIADTILNEDFTVAEAFDLHQQLSGLLFTVYDRRKNDRRKPKP